MLELLTRRTRRMANYTANPVTSRSCPAINLNSPWSRSGAPGRIPGAAADFAVATPTPPHSFVSLEGFLNAKLLVEVLKRMGPHPVRAKIAETVAGIDGFELGMGRPISFAAQRNQGSDAIYYTTVEDGRFVPIRDWKGWSK